MSSVRLLWARVRARVCSDGAGARGAPRRALLVGAVGAGGLALVRAAAHGAVRQAVRIRHERVRT
eukprot:3194413-Pleurochrysis_carterae.AAC.1